MERPTRLRQSLLVIIAGASGSAVFLLVFLVARSGLAEGQSILVSVVKTLSYFTILSNLLVAAVTSTALLSGPNTFLTRPGTMSAAAVYIIVVMVIYIVLLEGVWNPTGLRLVIDIVLHYVVPPLYILFWLAFVPKGSLRLTQAVRWLAFPAVYVLYSLARGYLTTLYPYPFADVTTLGYARVLGNAAMILAFFFIVGLLIVGADRTLAQLRQGTHRLSA